MDPTTFAYLDCAASTPMSVAAVEAMQPYLRDRFANPSGGHAGARAARAALEDARDIVAAAVGARPAEVVFTSGGTESDNLAIRGIVDRRGGIPVCSAVEHHAVLHPVEHHGGRIVGVRPTGRLDLDALADALDDEVSVVSVMGVNNETGIIDDLAAVTAVVHDRAPRAVVHTDAVQAVCWLDVAELHAAVDMLSISAHKFGGPKGVGALVVRDGVRLAPLLLGGGHEQERRSGTQNVAGAVAMAAALGETVAERSTTAGAVAARRDRLEDGLLAAVPGARPTSPRSARVPGTCHLVIEGVVSESLLVLLEEGGVLASAASSCASGAMDPSHVLAAMGFSRDEALGSLRLSLGPETADSEIERALEVIPEAVRRLRSPVAVSS